MDGTKAVIQVTMLGIWEATDGEGECHKRGREFMCILSLTHLIFCVENFPPIVFSARKYLTIRTIVTLLG